MKILFTVLVIVAVLLVAYFVIAARTDTYWGRWMAWKASDIDDYQRFPAHKVDNAPPVFNFEQPTTDFPIGDVPYTYKGNANVADLEALLESTGTTAFLVIKDDVLLYEGYFNGYARDSINTSFSIAKSVTSLLVGIALDQGIFDGLDDPITKYIPELLETDSRYKNITLEHLLSMKSGIAFRDHDLPWGDKPKAYYHPQLREVVLNLQIASPPGEIFVYNTYNPIILGIALERASGQTVAQFFEAHLWQQLGMEFDASWSIDSVADNMAKMESGINARAIDFAKIGRLVLRDGNWNGNQVVSKKWINQSTFIEPNNRVDKFGKNVYYQLGWWIYGPTDDDFYTVFGWGHLGQYLFIFPEENMIVVRFGKKIGRVDSWHQIAEEIILRVRDNNSNQ